MKNQEIRRRLSQAIDWLLRKDKLPVDLRPYQRETLEKIKSWLDGYESEHRAHFVYATGLGKTFVFSALIRASVGMRCLVIVPSKVLVEQTAQAMSPLIGGMLGHISSVPKITSGNNEVIALQGHKYADVVVTTDESFMRYSELLRREFDPHLIIWDECHTGYGEKPQHALARFDEAVIIGCSATPDYLGVIEKKEYASIVRSNGMKMFIHPEKAAGRLYGRRLDDLDLQWGVGKDWLAPLSWGTLDIAADLNKIPLAQTEAGWDFNAKALYKAMLERWPDVIWAVLNAYNTNEPYEVAKKSAYALCPGIGCALRLAEAMEKNGITSECIHSGTGDKRRRLVLRAFEEGKVQFLTSVMVLREGWDAPAAEVCWMLRPTYSYVLYVQAIGRAVRKSKKNRNKVAMVIDPSFRGTTLSPLNVPALFAREGAAVIPGNIILAPEQPVGRS